MPVLTQNMTVVVRCCFLQMKTELITSLILSLCSILSPHQNILCPENRDVRLTAFLELDGLMTVLRNTMNSTSWFTKTEHQMEQCSIEVCYVYTQNGAALRRINCLVELHWASNAQYHVMI